jgi:trimeric autotransporter adhesin
LNPSGTNDLVITIGGDLTDLQAAFDQLPQMAEEAFANVQQAISSLDFSNAGEGAEGASTAIGNLGIVAGGISGDLASVGTSASASDEAMSEAASAADQLGESWVGLASSASSLDGDLADVGDSAETVDAGFSDFGDSLGEAGDAMESAAADASDFSDAMGGLGDASDVDFSGVAQGASDVSESLASLSDAASTTDDTVTTASDDLSELGDAATTADSAFADIGESLTTADDAMQSAGEAASTLATDMGELGSGGGVDFATIADQATELSSALDGVGEAVTTASTGLTEAGEAVSAIGADFSTVSDSAATFDGDLATVSDSAAGVSTDVADLDEVMGASATSIDAAVAAAGELANEWGDLSEGADEAGGTLDVLNAALNDTAEAAGAASEGLAEVPEELDAANEGAEEAESSFGAMSESLEGLAGALEGIAAVDILKDVGSEAITAAANIQAATVSLTAFGMSANQASETIENLEKLAVNDALSMPDLLLAETRFAALQIPASQVTALIIDAAGAANTMNTSLNRVVNQIDNMVAAGTVSVSTLTRMGISANSFVDAINRVAGQGTADLNDLTQAFQGLSQTQAIQVVEIAMQNMGAAVTAQAATIKGQLQIIETQWDLVMEDIGGTIAPATGAVLTGINQIISAFRALPAPIRQSIEVLAAVGTTAAVAAIGVAGLVAGINALAGSALIGSITAATAGLANFATDITAVLTGLEGAAASAAAFTLGLGALAVSIGGIIGWNLGKYLSDWIDSLRGVSSAASETSESAQQLGTSETAASGPTSTLSAVLADLGVNQSDLAQKTKDTVVALQSFAQAALSVGQAAQNVVVTQQNAAQTFALTAQEYAKGTVQLTQYVTALDALDKAQEAANSGLESSGTAALMAVAAYQQLQVASTNATTTFTAVASAYSLGQASLSQYTAALAAMNKAQMDANNGIELAGTAALIAANDYVNIAAKATNAQTTVSALGGAAAAGTASWTQYDAALKQLVTDEEDANNGLVSLATEILVQQEALQNLGVTAANAATAVQAITSVMGTAALGTKAYTDALNALQTAQEAASGGAMNLDTALLQAANAQAAANLAWHNAEVALQAAYEYYMQTGQGVEQLIELTEKLATAQTAASNGVLSWVSAQQELLAQNAQLQINLTNANTLLAQAQQLYEDGAIGLGQLQKAQQAVTTAQDALNGTTKTATTATQALTTAHTGLTTALSGTATAMTSAAVVGNDFASSLQIINGQMVSLGGQATDATDSTNDFASSVQVLDGEFTNLGGQAAIATAGMQQFGGSVNVVNGQLVTLGATTAPAAAAAIGSVGTAAKGAASQVADLSSELDTFMGDLAGATSLSQSLDVAMGDLGGQIGNLSVSLSAGQTYTTHNAGGLAGAGLGFQDPSELVGLDNAALQALQFDTMQMTYLGTSTTAATAATTANTTATTANTAATAANTSGITASTETSAALANSLTNVWTQYQDGEASLATLTTATTAAAESFASGNTTLAAVWAQYQEGEASLGQLVSATLAAADSMATVSSTATESVDALNALNDGAVPFAVSLAGMASEVTDASTAIAAAGVVVSNASTELAAKVTAALGPAQGVGGSLNTPTIGTATPVISTSGTTEGETLNPAYNANFSITIQAGTVVGSGGMQQLANMVGNQLVKNMNQSGIRITRQ